MDFEGMKRRDLQALCKRHGLPAGGTNAALAARLAAAAALPGAAGAEEEEVVARKGCLKRSAGCGNVGEANKVSFALESSRGRRRKSQVFCSPVVVVAKTRGRAKAAEKLSVGSPVAETGGRGRRQGKCAGSEVGANSADEDGIAAAKAGVGASVRRSRRNSVVGLSDAVAEDSGEAAPVDRKRKRKSEEQDQDIAVTAQVGVSCRVTRRSSLSGAALLPPPAVEKKKGRRKAADGTNEIDAEEDQVAEAQDLSAAASPAVVESKRSGTKGQGCEPVAQKSAKVEANCRVTRSRATAAATAMPPLAVENKKRRKAEDVQPDVGLPAVSEVPTNDASVTRASRNRVVQLNSCVVEETHVAKKLENKGQPSRPATRRNQQLASSVGEEHQEQVAAPSKFPVLRRSGRNISEASNADSETSKSSSAPMEANELNIARPCTRHNAKGECMEKQPAVKEPARRSTRKSVVSGMLEKEVNDLIAEKGPEPEVHARRSKRKSVVLVNDIKGVEEDIQNAKGDDVVKQQAIKEPVRRSTRKSVVSAMLEEEGKDLIAEKSPEAHVRRSKRKSVVPVKGSKGDGEEIQNAEGEDVVKQPAIKEPVRRSTRKSVVSAMLEEEGKNLIAEKSSEAHVRRSKQKSVVPVKGSKGDGEEIQNAEGEDVVKQPAIRAPVRRSTPKSVVSDMLEEEGKDLIAEKSPEAHVRRSKRKSAVPVKGSKGNGDEIQNAEGEDVVKQPAVRAPARRSTCKSVVSNMLEKEKNDLIVGKKPEARVRRSMRKSVVLVKDTKDVGEDIQNADGEEVERLVVKQPVRQSTRESILSDMLEHKSGFVVAETNAEASVSRPKRKSVVPNMLNKEAQDDSKKAWNEDQSGKAKRTEEHSDIQIDDGLLCETRIGELDQSSSITELVPHTGFVSEDETLRDVGEVNFGDKSIQIVNASTGEVGLEDSKTSADIAQVIGPATAVFILDAEAPIDEGTTINAETKQSDAASVPALPISDSRQEIHSDEQSIHDADPGKCLSKDIEGNPLSINLHSDGAAADSTLPAPNAVKGCSPDERRSSLGLDFLFAEERKESYSGNDKNIAVEVDYGSKPSACVTPSFYTGSDCCVEDENVQPIGNDAEKTLDVGQGVAQEEYVAEEKSTDEHVAAGFDLNTKLNDETVSLYMESDCILDEKNRRLVADNRDDEQAMVQVQQDAVQDGTLETSSLRSATQECKHECGLPEESVLHSIKNKGCSSSAEQSSLGLQPLFSQEGIDDWMEHGALASAKSKSESGVDQLKDCHVQCTVKKATVLEPVSHQYTHLVSEIDDCMCMSQQNNGIEGLPEVSHEEERVSSSLSDFSVDANHTKEVNFVEVSYKGDGNKKIFHSDDFNTSCEKSCVNVLADSYHGISGTVFSSSRHAPAIDNDDKRLGSNMAQLESTDLLDELIGGSNTEVLHRSKEEQCFKDRENQVASRPCTNATTDVATAKNIESVVVLLPAEKMSNLKDEQLNSKMESVQVLESDRNSNKDTSNTSDNGSIAGIAGKRTSPGFIVPKDSPADHYLQHELLDEFSVEKSESAMSGWKNVSNAGGSVENPSLDLATPDCNNKGALFEEVVHTMKNYVGTCSSNPRELLMELQSMSSEANIEESNLDNLVPISGCVGDESTHVDQQDKVHLDSDLSQLESTDFVDELIHCSNTEELHQGHKERCNEDTTEEHVASGPCTNDTTEAATVKYIESAVELLPVEERSDLHDGQLSSMLESAKAVESSLSSNKDVRDILDHGSVGIVGKRTPSGSCLPKVSSMDLYPQLEHLEDLSMEKSLERSSMFGDNGDSRIGGTFGNPSSGLVTPNYKHKGGLSEEVVNTMINYVGGRPSNPRELLMELQSSNENIADFDTHDSLAFPSAERGVHASTICNIGKLLDTVVSSELQTYHSPSQDFSRAEGKQGCTSIFLHDDEEGFLMSNHVKDWTTSAHFSEDTHNIERDVVTEKGLCKEKEKRESMPSTNSNIVHENSHSKGYGICQSSSEKHIDEINSELWSGDTEVLHQDCDEESHEVNEDKVILAVLVKDVSEAAPGEGHFQTSGQQCVDEISTKQLASNIEMLIQDNDKCTENNEDLITPGIPDRGTSEAAQTEISERELSVNPAAGTSACPDEQINSKLEGNEAKEHICSYDKDTSSLFSTESVENSKASNLPKDTNGSFQ